MNMAPLQPAAAADVKLGGDDSLASLLAACPPSLHTGIVDSVCRCVWLQRALLPPPLIETWARYAGTSWMASWYQSCRGQGSRHSIPPTRWRFVQVQRSGRPRHAAYSASHPPASQMLFLVIHSFIFRRLAATLALM
jgi:hypothetical protein